MSITKYLIGAGLCLVLGRMIESRRTEPTARMRIFSYACLGVLIVFFALYVTFPTTFGIVDAVGRLRGRPVAAWARVLLTVVDMGFLYTATFVLPRLAYHDRWRGTSNFRLPAIVASFVGSALTVITWVLLYGSVEFVDDTFGSPVVRTAILLLLVAIIVAISGQSHRLFLSRRRTRYSDVPAFLERAIVSLSSAAGVSRLPCIVTDTTQSVVANAAAVGLFRRKLVFTSTLLDGLTASEVVGIAAHEIAHVRSNHSLVRYIIVVISLTGTMLLLSLFSDPMADVPVLFQFGVRFVTIIACAQMLPSSVYRMQELQADRLAVALTGDSHSLASGLLKTAKINHSVQKNHAAETVLSTHPSITRRIERLGYRVLPDGTLAAINAVA